jgi:purine-binding chemotaxis protein CheW
MSADVTTHRQVVVFSLGGEQYALPIESVSEIIRHTPPRAVAAADPYTHGVIGLRGKIVPVFDLAARIGVVAGEADKIVIVDNHAGQIGVTVDEVDEVLTLTSDQLERVPSADADAIEAIAKIEDRLVILLDPAGLFGDGERESALA